MRLLVKRSIHRFIIILMPAITSANSFAQFNSNFFTDSTQRFSVSVNGGYTYGSSVMNNTFMNKFLFGGTIDREMKDKAYQKLSSDPFYNRMGGDINYSINAEIPIDTLFGKTGLSLLIGLENKEHLDASFNEDLFRLTFDGNKQFAGGSAYLGNTSFTQYRFQYFNIGLVSYRKIKRVRSGVVLSFIKGEQFQSINVEGDSLYTDQYGRELILDLQYQYYSSDTGKTGWGAFNGVGFATKVFAEYYFENGDGIYFSLEDLGIVSWNKNSLNLATEDSYQFDGIQVNNIFDLNDSIVDKISKDSIIDAIATTNTKEGHYIFLPSAINVCYSKPLNDKMKVNFGVYHKILVNYFPLIYSNAYYYFKPDFAAKIQLAYGGYGRFNAGLAIAKSFANKLNVFIGTNNIEGFIIPDNAYSNSAFIGIKKYF